MNSSFTLADWLVFILYFAIIAAIGVYYNRHKANTTREFFLGNNTMPMWVVAVSVLATAQSAATFLGGPDSGYRGNLTYLATNIGGILGAIFVARVFIPRFYQLRVTTVYELLETRFGARAKRQAGTMYLIGRIFASGSRLYMAGIAVAMILFNNIAAQSVITALLILTVVGLAYTYSGGIRSVIWSDLIQCLVYVGAAIAVVIYLYTSIPASFSEILHTLQHPSADAPSKLTLFDFNLDFSPKGTFSFWACITGFLLLNIGAFGLDQDMTQRVLTCKSAKEGANAMILSIIYSIPVVFIFMCIGLLLYIYYQHPELSHRGAEEIVQKFQGEKITIFMYYVLHEMPAGLRGLVTVGVIAATLSTLNSGLNSMSSVAISDLYRPWAEKRHQYDEAHYLKASRYGMAIAAIALCAMAILCFFWQRYSDTPLLSFALSVMVFAYTGLLGVYFTAIFSKRGSPRSVLAALIAGFVITLLLQPYIWDITLGKLNPNWAKHYLAFPYQLCIGTALSTLICLLGKGKSS